MPTKTIKKLNDLSRGGAIRERPVKPAPELTEADRRKRTAMREALLADGEEYKQQRRRERDARLNATAILRQSERQQARVERARNDQPESEPNQDDEADGAAGPTSYQIGLADRLAADRSASLLPPALVAQLSNVTNHGDEHTLEWSDGRRSYDRGREIATDIGDDTDADRMIAIAVARDWTSIDVAGSDKWIMHCTLAAAKQGLEIRGATDEEQLVVERVQAEIAEAVAAPAARSRLTF